MVSGHWCGHCADIGADIARTLVWTLHGGGGCGHWSVRVGVSCGHRRGICVLSRFFIFFANFGVDIGVDQW